MLSGFNKKGNGKDIKTNPSKPQKSALKSVISSSPPELDHLGHLENYKGNMF